MSTTTNLGFIKPATGESGWLDDFNDNSDLSDTLITALAGADNAETLIAAAALVPRVEAVESAIVALQEGIPAGHIGFSTKALMDADLAHAAGTLAEVTNDPTEANNGLYLKLGASGAGSWQQASDDRLTTVEAELATKFGYVELLDAGDNIDGTTPKPNGAYMISANAALPGGTFPTGYNTTKLAVFLSIEANTHFIQILMQDAGAHIWVRYHKNTVVPTSWISLDWGYISTLTNTSTIDGTTPKAHGTYVLGTGASIPAGTFPTGYDTTKIGYLASIASSGHFLQILGHDGSAGNFWIRYHKNGVAPYAWQKLGRFYVRVLTASDNVDTMLTEGAYIVNTGTTPGTYPAELTTYGILVTHGYGNFWVQTISNQQSSLVRTRAWMRTYLSGWTGWIEITNPEATPSASAPFAGKTIVFMGDSIIKGTGDLSNIPQYVGDRTGATCINVGVGGTQMATHLAAPDYDPFCFYSLATAIATNTWTNQDAKAATIGATAQLTLLKATDFADVDYLVVAYGQNDRSNGVLVGANTSVDNDEFYGALKNGLDDLLTEFPNLKIMLVTPYNRPDYDTLIGPFADAIIDVAENFYRLPCLDLYRKGQVTTYTESTLLEDGLHPKNTTGYAYFGNKIAAWLVSEL